MNKHIHIVYEQDIGDQTSDMGTRNWAALAAAREHLPCTGCEMREYCAEAGTECMAYRQWVLRGHAQKESRRGKDLR